jgi:hypothetical protein
MLAEMKALGWLLVAILGAVALWQLMLEMQRGTFGVVARPSMERMSQDDVLRAAGPPLTKYGENNGGETWQYTNGRIVRFNYRGEAVEVRGFSALMTPAPRRPRSTSPGAPDYVITNEPDGSRTVRTLPPGVSHLQSVGGTYRPLPATPTDIERQRGWKSSSPLDQRPPP